MLQAAHPADWMTVKLTGRVEGKGQNRKTKVKWTLGQQEIVLEHGSKLLELVQRAGAPNLPPPAPSAPDGDDTESSRSADSDMDISDDGEGAIVDAVPADPDDAPPDSSLSPGGLVWTPEPDGITLCPRETSQQAGSFGAKLKWPRNASGLDHTKVPMDYWLLMFPNILDDIVNWTNSSMPNRAARTSRHEVVKFFGIMYAMTLYPSRQRSNYWATEDSALFPAPAFGRRFGMSRDRWSALLKYLRFCDPAEDEEVPVDPWREVRTLVNGFNRNRAETVCPGWVLVIDESTSKWRGLGDWYELGMPHITKIPRKPEPVGAEIKDLCDGTTGIMLWLELMEGSEIMKKKPFCEPGVLEGTAMCLRATVPWHGSGRVLLGDAAFASVQTCIRLKKVGLYFTGIVKGSSRFYPKRHLQTMQMAQRGDTATFTASKDQVSMVAHVWNDPGKPGKARKALICTCGTTLPADPSVRPRKRKLDDGSWETYFKEIPRTKIVETYFTYAGAIDRHNRVRMDGIRMERVLEFKVWSRRVVSSILGIIATDAYYAYKYENEDDVALDVFMEELAKEMIWNTLHGCPDGANPPQTRQSNSDSISQEAGFALTVAMEALQQRDHIPEPTALTCKHNLKLIRELPKYKGKAKATLTCCVCRKQAANYYCIDCSKNPHQRIVALCGLETQRQCVSMHCAT